VYLNISVNIQQSIFFHLHWNTEFLPLQPFKRDVYGEVAQMVRAQDSYPSVDGRQFERAAT
jgi:hypothetical protein